MKMSDRMWSIDEVIAKVEVEGLGYMVSSYLSADAITDPELARLWREAKGAMSALEAFLDTHAAEEVDGGEPEGAVFVHYTALLCDSVPNLLSEESVAV